MAPLPDRRGHSVLAVANEFLRLAADNDVRLTPMHLQKLCYYAQGFNLAYTGNPIIHDPVEAWDFGPVFPRLYKSLRKYGAGVVTEPIHENNWARLPHVRGAVVEDEFHSDERKLIGDVFKTYARFEPFKLSALTHEEGTPWSKVYRRDKNNLPIPSPMIKEYFSELAAA
jgi:uncharacterized phage-associated protein